LWVRIRAEEAAMGPRYALEFGGRMRLVPKFQPRTARRESGARRTTSGS